VPDWYRVPLCHGHHADWAHGSSKHAASRIDKEHLIVIAVGIMAQVSEAVMKTMLGIESLNELTPGMLERWENVLNEPKEQIAHG